MISAVIIYNLKGEVIVSRLYRDGLRRTVADVFRIQVLSQPESRSPVLTMGQTSFFHVRHENVYVVAITRFNADAGMVFEFLYKVIDLGTSYFSKFDEHAVKSNFTLIYELLDEVLDFGFPQQTDINTLKQYITTDSVKSSIVDDSNASKITSQATGSISWRPTDLKYRKNEVFVDTIEQVNLLLSATGAVLRADVDGKIVLKTKLSGMPECRFGLNDSLLIDSQEDMDRDAMGFGDYNNRKAAAGSVALEDCQFHQCVKLSKFDQTRSISFVPPDGTFDLLRYRAVENIQIPFKVVAHVQEVGKSKVEYSVILKANFSKSLSATDVVVNIPTPLNASSANVHSSLGRAKYDPSGNQIKWKVGRVTGGVEVSLTGEASLSPSNSDRQWSRPPISMDFSISMLTCSGIVVRYLKIFEKSNYNTIKWVKYVSKAGSYEIRY